MKCIDVIEGAVKSILNHLHKDYAGQKLDDSEYIRNVKAVLDATDHYVRHNPEVAQDPQMLKQVLYVYSRNLWLMGQHPMIPQSHSQRETLDPENDDYQTYYFDFLYNRGVYPG